MASHSLIRTTLKTVKPFASLTGIGGVWDNRVYASPNIGIPGFELKIVHLEMINVLIAIRVWANYWRHKKVTFFCDNMAVVQVVQSGKTKDPMLAACIRNMVRSCHS